MADSVINSFLLVAWILHSQGMVFYNSIVDVFLAMPFFTMGFLLRPFKMKLSTLPMKWLPLLIVISGVGIWLCGMYNGIVMLYRCSYGDNLLLCLVGAISGTVCVYAVSMICKSLFTEFVRVLGGGTFVILGMHFVVIQIVNGLIPIHGLWLYVESFLILLAFFPIILFIEKHIPILYGKLRKTSRV